jgi:pyridoxamine 5'-phosphate oxidase
MDKKTLAELRRDYSSEELSEKVVDRDPFVQFAKWVDDALATGEIDANAMIASTVDAEGRPSARVVLLKSVENHSLVFFTNYDSNKAADLANNPNISLHFFWPGLNRQIGISGVAAKVSREESEQYFATRPRESQAGAWASHQSSVIANRTELEGAFADVNKRYAGQPIPCPPNWGGYSVLPSRFEFWQGRASRLHDRVCYTLVDDTWQITRLAP